MLHEQPHLLKQSKTNMQSDLVISKMKDVQLGNWIFFQDAAVLGKGEWGEPHSSFTIHKHCFGKRKARILNRDAESDGSVQMLDFTVFRKQVQNLFLRDFILLKITKIKEITFGVSINEFPQNVLLLFLAFLDRIHVLLLPHLLKYRGPV